MAFLKRQSFGVIYNVCGGGVRGQEAGAESSAKLFQYFG